MQMLVELLAGYVEQVNIVDLTDPIGQDTEELDDGADDGPRAGDFVLECFDLCPTSPAHQM